MQGSQQSPLGGWTGGPQRSTGVHAGCWNWRGHCLTQSRILNKSHSPVRECLHSVPYSPSPLLACRERQVTSLIMTALGLPLRRLLRELQAPPSCVSSSPDPAQTACLLSEALAPGRVALPQLTRGITGGFPEPLFTVRSFLPPAFLDSWT